LWLQGRSAFAAAVVLAIVVAAALVWERPTTRELDGPLVSTAASASAIPPPAVASVPTPTSEASAEPDAGTVVAALPPVDALSRELCPPDMVLVDGVFGPFVAHRCGHFLDPPSNRGTGFGSGTGGRLRLLLPKGRRCAVFKNLVITEGRPSRLHLCIDRFEYPNLEGVKPVLMASFEQAERACRAESKRLCEHSEWTFACEGPRTWPYPTGIKRPTAGACNLDRRARVADERALAAPHDVAVEVERLDLRTPAGSKSACLSPFGAYDMAGNVSEWVYDRDGDPAPQLLKGGMWGPSQGECRTSAAMKHRDRPAYHGGFRCCANTNDGLGPSRLLDPSERLPKRRKLLLK